MIGMRVLKINVKNKTMVMNTNRSRNIKIDDEGGRI